MEQRLNMNSREIADTLLLCRKTLSALSDETRQQIILALLQSDQYGVRVGELTDKTRLSRPAISHHLQILRDAELVNMRRDGTRNYYYISNRDSKWGMLNDLLYAMYGKVLDISRRGQERD